MANQILVFAPGLGLIEFDGPGHELDSTIKKNDKIKKKIKFFSVLLQI